MLLHPDIWRDLRSGQRLAIWLGTFCTLVMLWGGYFLSGPRQVKKTESAQIQQQLASLAVQRGKLWSREKDLPRDGVHYRQRVIPFSALHFQSPEASLVSWKPDEKGGELVLETRWSPLPALFEKLAEREMIPAAFSIEPEGSLLRFTLHLEAIP